MIPKSINFLHVHKFPQALQPSTFTSVCLRSPASIYAKLTSYVDSASFSTKQCFPPQTNCPLPSTTSDSVLHLIPKQPYLYLPKIPLLNFSPINQPLRIRSQQLIVGIRGLLLSTDSQRQIHDAVLPEQSFVVLFRKPHLPTVGQIILLCAQKSGSQRTPVVHSASTWCNQCKPNLNVNPRP